MDALEDGPFELDLAGKAKVFCVTRAAQDEKEPRFGALQCLRIPNVPLTRMGQVKIAVFLALSRGLIKHGDRVVFLSGLATAKTLDTIIVTEVGREYEILASGADLTMTSSQILPEVIERVVDIASELGSEGREGRAVGAMFVIGDTDHVLPLTRQLVLNPFKGYPPQERNILDYSLEETVKELATLDGAFILRGDGVDGDLRHLHPHDQPAGVRAAAGPRRPAPRRRGHHGGNRLHRRHRQRIHRLDHHLPRRPDHHGNPETPQHGREVQAPPLPPGLRAAQFRPAQEPAGRSGFVSPSPCSGVRISHNSFIFNRL